jgi:hypothetical protein
MLSGLFSLPRRLERRHRIFARRGIAAVKHRVRESGGDRPKPRCVARRRVRPKDSADLAAIIVEHQEVVILAELGGFKR